MSHTDLLDLFLHFASLSMLAIGGALATTPEMHRYLVDQKGWLDSLQFHDAIAIAQAAPGPNILFVTLLGWQAGGAMGALAATLGQLLPSSIVTLWAWRWKQAHDQTPLVSALRAGLSPMAIGLTAAAGWLIASGSNGEAPGLWALTLGSAVIVWRTRLNPVWLIVVGAGLGMLGVVG